MKKVGILYDNISGNIGDQAIGISVRDMVAEMATDYEELVPGRFDPCDYRTVIVGGGHLLRPSPDFFYDKFKVPGKHILNSCGIVDSPDDLQYLDDYTYVTVRSNGDKQKLSYLSRGVTVVPCTSMLLKDLRHFDLKIQKPSIGVHLWTGAADEKVLAEYLANQPFHIYFLPITHYSHDFTRLERLSQKVKNSTLIPILRPEEIFTVIGNFDYFISISLHGAIFAYVHNVPFVLYELGDKQRFFMEDRKLDSYLFGNFDELKARFEELRNSNPDYSSALAEDFKVLQEHKLKIKDAVSRQVITGVQPVITRRESETKNQQAILQERNFQVHHLQNQVKALTTQTKYQATKIGSLEASLEEKVGEIYRLESQTRRLESQTRRLESQIRRLESQIRQIQHSIPMQLAERYQRIVEKLLPAGTRCRRYYELVLSGLKIILTEGWRSFLARFKEWLLQNIRRPLELLWRRGAVAFTRGGNALLPYYQRFVPMRIKAMIPDRLKEAVKRRLAGNMVPVTIGVAKRDPAALYGAWVEQMMAGKVVAPFDEPVFGPRLLPDWSKKSEILRAFAEVGSQPLEELPIEIRNMAESILARKALKVSVVMPTWNRENVVANAVLSALSQAYPPAEVIVVDDGSEDKTCQLLEEQFTKQVASGQLRILRQAHQGVSAARNAGLASASGDLIAYLDSDNTWNQDYLLIMAAIFAECDEVATAYAASRCHILDEHRTLMYATPYDRRALLEENFIDQNAFMHRRFVYLQNGGFDDSLRRLVDWDLIISYTRLYPPAFVPLIDVEQYLDGKRLGNITKTVDLDQNMNFVLRKHLAERIRYGLEELRLAYILWDWPALSQSFVISEIRWLIRQGQDVNVYYKTAPDRAAKLDFDVEMYQVRDAQHLAELLVAHKRTFCHAHFACPATTFLAWPACEATGLPFTFFAHAVDIFHHDNRKRNRIADVVRSANCKKVFTYGEHHKAFLEEQGVPGEKIALNFQAVDLNLYEQIAPIERSTDNAPFKGVFIGRFIEKKGVDILLEAAAILRDEPVTFELYGYGPLEERCRQQTIKLGLDNVKFMGPIEHKQDMVTVLQSADFLVVPSVVAANGDTEGFPTVILEAMAAGRPVVTSAVSAIPDFLRDMVEAILVEPKNPEALASGVRRLLTMTPERRAAMSFEARRFLDEKVGVDKTMQVYLDIWRNNPVDIFLVTFNTAHYNHCGEAIEIIKRVMRHTTTPYTLTIVDNGSDYEFRKMLIDVATNQPQIRLIFKEENLFCGPASNIALEYGDAPLAIYLCSNEAFIGHHGWERALINHMRKHPEEVLAGTLVHLPKYTLGRELAAYPDFGKFRNPEFASQRPDRPFTHVQGGAFILRRGAVALYGGFSPALPQGGMDVEFSYFLESVGAQLGNVPQLASVTTKTLPGLSATVDEFTSVAHPLTRDTAHSILDERKDMASGICNICGELLGLPPSGGTESEQCAKCGSTPFGRTIYRRLAHDWRAHRGGRAVLVTSDRAVGLTLGQRMFRLAHAPGSVEAACAELVKAQGIIDLVVIDPDCVADTLEHLWDAALSALRPAGLLLCTDGRAEAFSRNATPPPLLDAALKRRGWSVRPSFPEARLSRILRLDWRRLFEVEASPYPDNLQIMEKTNENPTRACNICGGTKFGAGPNGRMAENGMPPRCEGCQSLERHRATREVMMKLRKPLDFSRRRVLQFSHDRTVERRWFKSYELSIYGGDSSLDLQRIDRPSGSYDFVICNHVLEHVPDDAKALMEMARITSEQGFVFLTVPAPHRLTTTTEWGYPDEKQHGHYRIYGKDIVTRFERFIPGIIAVEIPMHDPVTGVPDIAFLLTRSEAAASQLRGLLQKTE